MVAGSSILDQQEGLGWPVALEGGPPTSIHILSLPQIRGEGPVAEGPEASREYFCPRSDCSPGLSQCTKRC